MSKQRVLAWRPLPGHGHLVIGTCTRRRQNGTGLSAQDDPELYLHFVGWVTRRITDGTQLPHQAGCHRPSLLHSILKGGLSTLHDSRSRKAAPCFTPKSYVFYFY